MAGILDMQTGSLPASRTYARRDWVWMPADPGDGRLGTLTIVLQHSRRSGAKQESDSYAVEHDTAPLNTLGRAFLLCNETDPDQADVYRVTIAPHRSGDSCTCDAGRVDVGRKRKAAGELECKHRGALRQMLECGAVNLDTPAVSD